MKKLILTFFFLVNTLFAKENLEQLFSEAEQSVSRGSYFDAIDQYEKILSLIGDSKLEKKIFVLEKLGTLYTRKSNYEEAINYQSKTIIEGCKFYGEGSLFCADSHKNLGSSYEKIENFDSALSEFIKAQTIYEKILPPSDSKMGLIANLVGRIHFSKGNFQEALQNYLIDLKISKNHLKENSPDLAMIYNNIGIAYRNLGYYDLALQYYKKDFEINNSNYGLLHKKTSVSINNLAAVYLHKGDYEKAIQEYNKSLEIHLKLKPQDRNAIADVYNNIGTGYEKQGEMDKSIVYFNKSIDIFEKEPNSKYPLSMSYSNLGIFYSKKSQYKKSQDYYAKALKILDELSLSSHPFYASVLSNLAISYFSEAKYKEALELQEKSLAILHKQYGEKHPDIAFAYERIAFIYLKLSENKKAEENFTKAVSMLEALIPNHPKLGAAYSSFGNYYYSIGNYEKSLEYFQKSVEILRSFKDRLATIDAMIYIKNCYLSLKQSELALSVWKDALAFMIRYRQEMGKDKYFFSERYRSEFEKLVFHYLSVKQYKEAFQVSEKMRALSITESFNLKRALSNGKINKEEIKKVLELLSEIEALNSARTAELNKGVKGEQQANKLFQELMKKEESFESLDKTLKNKYPEYGKLRVPPSLDLDSLLSQLRKEKKTIIEYLILTNSENKREIHAFVLGDEFHYISLGEENGIIGKIENLRRMISTYPTKKSRQFFEILTPESSLSYYSAREMEGLEIGNSVEYEIPVLDSPVNSGIDSSNAPRLKTITIGKAQRLIEKNEANEIIKKYSKEIYNQIVFPIVNQNFLNSKNIIIAPDGGLFTIPFSALIDEKDQYLVENYSFSFIQSASVWQFLNVYKKSSTFQYPILGIGNPIYNKNFFDESKKKTPSKREALKRGITIGTSLESIETELSNLPGSKEEIDSIQEMFYKNNDKAKSHLLTGISANKDEILKFKKDGLLSKYRVIHFSVHGLFFSDSPDMNSLALTSRNVVKKNYNAKLKTYEKENGKINSDSFLKSGEIQDLEIRSDLIVMSACETSLGTYLSGEGIVGLPQAFLIGGAKNVIATLWSIDDKGSMQFMKIFYRKLLTEKKYDMLSDLLLETQKEFISINRKNGKRKYTDPFYWSPFVIYGE